jgi:hypothetical protein
LHAQQGELVAVALRIIGRVRARAGLRGVAAGLRVMPLVNLLVGLTGRARVLAARAQVGARPRVVVVARGVAAAGELVAGNDAVKVFGIELPAGRVVVDLCRYAAFSLVP